MKRKWNNTVSTYANSNDRNEHLHSQKKFRNIAVTWKEKESSPKHDQIKSIQEQFESIRLLSSSGNEENWNEGMNIEEKNTKDDEVQEEEATGIKFETQNTVSYEERFYNVDLQHEFCHHSVLKQYIWFSDNSLIDYKRTKRFQMQKIEYNYENELFSIHVKPISGISECVTPKTDKLLAVFSEKFSFSQRNSIAIPLFVSQIDSSVIFEGSMQYLGAGGDFKVRIEQWLDAEKNKESDIIETKCFGLKYSQAFSVQQSVNYTNLYLRFSQELMEGDWNFEELAVHYLKNNMRDFGGFNLLMHYACRNDVDASIKLLELGFNLDDSDRMGYNTIYWCQHFAAFDVMRAIIERDNWIPKCLLRVQVDDPSRIQLNEYNWKHFYLSSLNKTCKIRCRQVVPLQQQLRVRLCNPYQGILDLKCHPHQPDIFELTFSDANYKGAIVIELFDTLLNCLIAESDPITIYDSSSIYQLICSDMNTTKSCKRSIYKTFPMKTQAPKNKS